MLDSQHPLSAHIMAAAAIEDQIRQHLLRLPQASGSAELIGLTETIELELIPQLRQLHQLYFPHLPAIAKTLDALALAVNAADWDLAWERFLDLAERPGTHNFGTWAI
jgi:hypothetical protein